ncbi:hypothetical protein EFK50_07340 [Nocardioides marmoriginsengisoli]|uniref:Uncharacterized protein n=1 Tax=Nocardioides marmoriginsengisoli TaxID=661483 RepID=A0A3N0CN48_9ACTN|nr:hypothetical protein [Nocardioides marmoriginsengisoli]RNL64333.1 hypothetical protein EFK50_07340 [Nocardioides marmoriginsengisoli]
MKRVITMIAASMAILGLTLGAAAPAMAVAWKSKTDPLFGYEDGDKFGKAYGNYYNDGNVSAMSTSYQYDIQAGGNNVRMETDFYFYEVGAGCTGGGACWVFDVSKQTPESNDAAWIKASRARNLHGKATGTRGGINICEIQAWHPDPCSAHAWPSFSY